MMRIGYGYDVHKLEENRKLILGGVEILFEKGLTGHSDADVLIHSIIDAILGALAKGDIGKLFPDSDDKYKDIDSRILLRKVTNIMAEAGYEVGNLDATICAQDPKLQTHIPQMRKNIASDLHTEFSNISLKATTEENLGISGKGISATAVVLLRSL
ncbi:MAG: 2-C-methyl-D-erythritol 2,4-cyclodiphosphate synthase [Candidatus Cloacimonetes bacterium]|nr:2-C-methyl-D-erythritol 2,4-cyclodiphosphate synthase [Candidatus Cloacimonadota bacterium]MBL7149781.1 2-C-methyl-D-erythritol 2,4-cyclodiphosphate synthase [Candidatus Cloacimonadota bacterium]